MSPLEFGIITPAIMRFFRFLKKLPPHSLHDDRTDQRTSLEEVEDPVAKTQARARKIDRFILGCLLIEAVLLVLAAIPPATPSIAYVFLPAFRILNIVTVTFNMTMFDRTLAGRDLQVASITRILILGFVNFAELIACFGLVYFGALDHVKGAYHLGDALYLSVMTQLTVGYGDVTPLGWLRAGAASQAIIGFTFAVIIIARFVSLLPDVREVQGQATAPSSKADAEPAHEAAETRPGSP